MSKKSNNWHELYLAPLLLTLFALAIAAFTIWNTWYTFKDIDYIVVTPNGVYQVNKTPTEAN